MPIPVLPLLHLTLFVSLFPVRSGSHRPDCLDPQSLALDLLLLPRLALPGEKIAFALLARCFSSLLHSCAPSVTSTVVCSSSSALASSLLSVYSSRISCRTAHCSAGSTPTVRSLIALNRTARCIAR